MTRNIIKPYLSLLFLSVGCLAIFLSLHEPLRDFGNYYYGSRLLLDGKFNHQMYTSIHYFNQQINSYGEINFFENYIPVTPFSAVFYVPFCFFKSLHAKLLFNILSLLLLCCSIYRLQNFHLLQSKIIYVLPVIFFYPLYNNILQGQAYVLLCALLIEVYMASEKKQIFLASFLMALIISLKIFPVILLLYFLLKRNFKTVGLTVLFLLLFFFLSYFILPPDTISYYFSHVLPRLFNNDVVGTYYHGNQSVYTSLLQLFSYDELSNPHPLVNYSFLIVIFESLFVAFLLTFIFLVRNKNTFLFFSFVLFSSLLLGRYNTGYSLILLLPFCVSFILEDIKHYYLYLLFICVFVTNYVPVGSLASFPFLIKFSRLWGLILILILAALLYRLKMDYKLFAILFILVTIFKFISFPIQPINYFTLQNTKGILYDITVGSDSIILKSTLGEKDYLETFAFKAKAELKENLIIEDNVVYYKDKVICNTKDNKLNPFVYNDTSVVFMSDLNQAVGFYKLRYISLDSQ